MNTARLVNGVLVLVIAVLISACGATPKRDLVADNIVIVKAVDSEYSAIELVNVHQHDEGMEIEVVVRPKNIERFFSAGEIKVDIDDPNGNKFSFVESNADRDHCDRFSKLQHAHFWVKVPYTPGQGTVVSVTHIDTSK